MPLDPNKIELPKFASLRPQPSKLNAWDYARLVVLSYLNNSSISGIAAGLIQDSIDEKWENSETALTVMARAAGLTPEELINQILSDYAGKSG
jgi:hypothetical protein